jgi:hypothetical protein
MLWEILFSSLSVTNFMNFKHSFDLLLLLSKVIISLSVSHPFSKIVTF